MERIKREDLEKMYGKMIEEKDLSIYGINKKLHFEIYDGFAYCPKSKDGKEYTIKYPQTKFVDDSVDIQNKIREALSLDKTDKISPLDILQVFNEMDIDGQRVKYNEENKAYEPKNLWVVEVM